MTDDGRETDLTPAEKVHIAQSAVDESMARQDRFRRKEMAVVIGLLSTILVAVIALGAWWAVATRTEVNRLGQLVTFVNGANSAQSRARSQKVITDIEQCVAWIVAHDVNHKTGAPPKACAVEAKAE